MNKTIKELIERKSIRIFLEKEIEESKKDLILKASVNAPTAGNMQLYSIIDVTRQCIKNKLAILCDNQSFIKKAPLVLIYCADYYKWQKSFKMLKVKPRNIKEGDLLLAMEDAIIAAQNAVTAAYALGIGSCYIGDIMENYEEVTKLLKLPQHVYPCCMLVFGYPDNNHTGKKPERFDNKYVIFENAYKQLNNKELKDMFKNRVNEKGFETYLTAFMNRKHNSAFSKEMSRSAKLHIKNFINNN